MNCIQLKNVCFSYANGTRIFDHLNLTVNPQEYIGVIGPNGSGKTTLARLLNAGLEPTSGTVTIDGWPSSARGNEQKIKQMVAVILADPENQIIAPTVFDEIVFGLDTQALTADEIHLRALSAMNDNQLEEHRDLHPHLLSTGEQIRLLLASAMARRPRYLVLDEIFSMLDGPSRRNIERLLIDLKMKHGLAIVHITHRLEELINADRIIVLTDGCVQIDETPASIFLQVTGEPSWRIAPPLGHQVISLLPEDIRAMIPDLCDRLLLDI